MALSKPDQPRVVINQPQVAMIQDGARRRYMVPLALQEAGILERVYIDWFVRRGSIESGIAVLVGKVQPRLGRKMAERSCPELDPARVFRNPAMALGLRMKMPKFPSSEDSFIWASEQTAKWVLRKGFGNANALYGFIRNASPRAYATAKSQGLRTSGDQIIAPLEVEVAEMREQQKRWPGWSESETISLHAKYLAMERETWDRLDQITCMSEYVRDGLISVGVKPERITVIPYPWTETPGNQLQRQPRAGPNAGPLTVGFVGAVGLRKGAPYFLAVARRFDPKEVRFVMVGNVLIAPEILSKYRGQVEFPGSVARSQVQEWLGKFDVFFFPTTCEGSAGAVMEAMAASLPVLTSPNAGSRVRDGIDGFVCRYDDLDRFEQKIREFAADRDLALKMGSAARGRVLSYNLAAYQKDLREFFTNLVNR
jgi:glycosyltransferase involved in cell wall biosynthesis